MDKYSYDYRTALTEVEEIAKQMFLKGTPPDGGEWHGKAPIDDIHVSFGGLKPSGLKFRGDRGEVTLETGRDSEGIYVDSFLLRRFLQAYPKEEGVLLELYEETLSRKNAAISRYIEKHFEDPQQAWKIGTEIFGFHESDEWEEPTDVKVKKVEIDRKARFDRFGRSMYVPWSVRLEFTSSKKTPIDEGPFTSMSDRELDRWIEEWENQAPENFWMDGELDMSRQQAYRMYRDRWRKMRPREQIRMMESLKKWM